MFSFKMMFLMLLVCFFCITGIANAQCTGGSCKRSFRTPVRSYFSQVKPIRHALMLSK